MTVKKISPTPTFMRYAVEAWRKDYLIGWAVFQTGKELGCDKAEVFDWVCNRPKTPAFDYGRKEGRSTARRWLARYFRPVSDALIDGASNAEAIRVWIKTDRNDTGPDREVYGSQDAMRGLQVIRSRQLAPKNGAFFRVR